MSVTYDDEHIEAIKLLNAQVDRLSGGKFKWVQGAPRYGESCMLWYRDPDTGSGSVYWPSSNATVSIEATVLVRRACRAVMPRVRWWSRERWDPERWNDQKAEDVDEVIEKLCLAIAWLMRDMEVRRMVRARQADRAFHMGKR